MGYSFEKISVKEEKQQERVFIFRSDINKKIIMWTFIFQVSYASISIDSVNVERERERMEEKEREREEEERRERKTRRKVTTVIFYSNRRIDISVECWFAFVKKNVHLVELTICMWKNEHLSNIFVLIVFQNFVKKSCRMTNNRRRKATKNKSIRWILMKNSPRIQWPHKRLEQKRIFMHGENVIPMPFNANPCWSDEWVEVR